MSDAASTEVRGTAEAAYGGHYRAGVIGHTGRGNYGHGLDLAACGLPGVEMVAVADADEVGRERAAQRTGAATRYADYRQMLETECLDLVVVGPRQPDQREAMLLAAIRAGAKAIYTEKPFARSLDEADRVLAAADARGVKIAVAHQNRAFPGPRLAQQLIAQGKIGRLRALKAYGKQDRRGGGQDLMVLGTHMLDLMRLFAGQSPAGCAGLSPAGSDGPSPALGAGLSQASTEGDARWCHARVCEDGRDATPADVRPGEEEVGPVAGDDIVAQYGFDRGITGSYESARAEDGSEGNYFRLDLCGSGGMVTIWSSTSMPVYYYPRPFALPDRADQWQVLQLESQPMPESAPEGASAMHPANQLLVRDLLAAVEQDRQPHSSGHDARAALEMIMAVYASHVAGGRVSLPLPQREHPLRAWAS